MNDPQTAALAQAWCDLWNNDLDQTDKIISPAFVSHAAPLTGGAAADSAGRELLDTWVAGIHQVLPGLRFSIQLGPFRDGDTVIVRWRADGTYPGGLPGTHPAAAGRAITFYGTDILRLENGLIAEYWANADSLWFVQQLGVREVPALG